MHSLKNRKVVGKQHIFKRHGHRVSKLTRTDELQLIHHENNGEDQTQPACTFLIWRVSKGCGSKQTKWNVVQDWASGADIGQILQLLAILLDVGDEISELIVLVHASFDAEAIICCLDFLSFFWCKFLYVFSVVFCLYVCLKHVLSFLEAKDFKIVGLASLVEMHNLENCRTDQQDKH